MSNNHLPQCKVKIWYNIDVDFFGFYDMLKILFDHFNIYRVYLTNYEMPLEMNNLQVNLEYVILEIINDDVDNLKQCVKFLRSQFYYIHGYFDKELSYDISGGSVGITCLPKNKDLLFYARGLENIDPLNIHSFLIHNNPT